MQTRRCWDPLGKIGNVCRGQAGKQRMKQKMFFRGVEEIGSLEKEGGTGVDGGRY